MKFPSNARGHDLWAITTYFNPVGYQRRLANYKIFRQRLDVPLIAIELAYGPDFELQLDDAEILHQIRGDAVLWQKEKLLNLALRAIPPECRKVAWLDCDIIFDDPQWSQKNKFVARQLSHCATF